MTLHAARMSQPEQNMDGPWSPKAARVPLDLTPERARRWCLMKTLHDARIAKHRGRPITRPNLRRLLMRRRARIGSIEHDLQ